MKTRKCLWSLLRFVPFSLLLIVALCFGSQVCHAFENQEGNEEPILLAASMVAAQGAAQERKGSAAKANKARRSILSDADGDGLSDGLQARLAGMRPDDLVDVVVTFREKGSAGALQKSVGPFKVKREFKIIPAFAATMKAAQARGLAKAAGVFRVEEDFKVSTMLDSANRDFGTEAAMNAFGVTGVGVGICVVDTGVDIGHEQLGDGKVVEFVDFVNGETDPYDDHGHGTHVASIAAGGGAGVLKGVASGASLYAAKVLNAQGSGSDSDVIAGVQWCADAVARSRQERPGVHIISMSLGAAGSSDGQDALSRAVDSAVSAGIVAVVAAGNSGPGSETVGSPGAAELAITVGAVAEWSAPPVVENHSEGIYLAPFSSRGPTADGRNKPDIAAPGVSIKAAQGGTVSGYVSYSGTSMATPFVAGAVALVLDRNPALSPGDIKTMLLDTAENRGPTGLDNDWGAGLIDAHALVAGVLNDVGQNAFPAFKGVIRTVGDNAVWQERFSITEEDMDIPIGVTLTIVGALECSLELFPGVCWMEEWSPDLDAQLIDPAGSIIAVSTCPASDDCGGDIFTPGGRQETLHAMPTVAGEYIVRVFPFSGEPNNGKGGDFELDVSFGPLSAGTTLPPNNQAPEVYISAPVDGSAFLAGQSIYFLATASDTEEGELTAGLTWTSNLDAIIGSGGSFNISSLTAGKHTITASVTDSGGLSGSTSVTIVVEPASLPANQSPVVTIKSPADGTIFDSGAKIRFAGSASDPEDGDVTDSLVWVSDRDGMLGSGGRFFTRLSDGTHTITAKADDSDGVSSSVSIRLSVGPLPPSGQSFHIGDLQVGPYESSKGGWTANVYITLHDASEELADGILVEGAWSGGSKGNATCITDVGMCKVTREMKKFETEVTFTASRISGSIVDTLANHDLDGDSDGTSITVNKQ